MVKRKSVEIQLLILKLLSEHGKLSFNKLRYLCNTSWQTIVNNCKILESRGEIKIERVKGDKTKYIAYITERGRETLKLLENL